MGFLLTQPNWEQVLSRITNALMAMDGLTKFTHLASIKVVIVMFIEYDTH